MKRFAAVVVLTVALLLARPASSQQPVPTDAPAAHESKPWVRLALFIPASFALGAGTVFVRRRLRERGWSET
jgi:hypothetical protein